MLENKIEQPDDWLFLILGHCESRLSCCQLSSVHWSSVPILGMHQSNVFTAKKKIMAVGGPVISVGLAGERGINPYRESRCRAGRCARELIMIYIIWCKLMWLYTTLLSFIIPWTLTFSRRSRSRTLSWPRFTWAVNRECIYVRKILNRVHLNSETFTAGKLPPWVRSNFYY